MQKCLFEAINNSCISDETQRVGDLCRADLFDMVLAAVPKHCIQCDVQPLLATSPMSRYLMMRRPAPEFCGAFFAPIPPDDRERVKEERRKLKAQFKLAEEAAQQTTCTSATQHATVRTKNKHVDPMVCRPMADRFSTILIQPHECLLRPKSENQLLCAQATMKVLDLPSCHPITFIPHVKEVYNLSTNTVACHYSLLLFLELDHRCKDDDGVLLGDLQSALQKVGAVVGDDCPLEIYLRTRPKPAPDFLTGMCGYARSTLRLQMSRQKEDYKKDAKIEMHNYPVKLQFLSPSRWVVPDRTGDSLTTPPSTMNLMLTNDTLHDNPKLLNLKENMEEDQERLVAKFMSTLGCGRSLDDTYNKDVKNLRAFHVHLDTGRRDFRPMSTAILIQFGNDWLRQQPFIAGMHLVGLDTLKEIPPKFMLRMPHLSSVTLDRLDQLTCIGVGFCGHCPQLQHVQLGQLPSLVTIRNQFCVAAAKSPKLTITAPEGEVAFPRLEHIGSLAFRMNPAADSHVGNSAGDAPYIELLAHAPMLQEIPTGFGSHKNMKHVAKMAKQRSRQLYLKTAGRAGSHTAIPPPLPPLGACRISHIRTQVWCNNQHLTHLDLQGFAESLVKADDEFCRNARFLSRVAIGGGSIDEDEQLRAQSVNPHSGRITPLTFQDVCIRWDDDRQVKWVLAAQQRGEEARHLQLVAPPQDFEPFERLFKIGAHFLQRTAIQIADIRPLFYRPSTTMDSDGCAVDVPTNAVIEIGPNFFYNMRRLKVLVASHWIIDNNDNEAETIQPAAYNVQRLPSNFLSHLPRVTYLDLSSFAKRLVEIDGNVMSHCRKLQQLLFLLPPFKNGGSTATIECISSPGAFEEPIAVFGTLPALIRIGRGFLAGCPTLRGVLHLNGLSSLRRIGDGFGSACSRLVHVQLHHCCQLTQIGDHFLQHCKAVKSVQIDCSVTTPALAPVQTSSPSNHLEKSSGGDGNCVVRHRAGEENILTIGKHFCFGCAALEMVKFILPTVTSLDLPEDFLGGEHPHFIAFTVVAPNQRALPSSIPSSEQGGHWVHTVDDQLNGMKKVVFSPK